MKETQVSKPDPFEEDIIEKLKQFNGIPFGKWPNPLATHDVKKAVGEVVKEKGYEVRATGYNQAEQREWLYDLTCIEYEGDYIKGIPLVMESEWDCDGLDDDFPKLVLARADRRVMILQIKSDGDKKEIIQHLLQYVQNCKYSANGDRYLFACWNAAKKKRFFDCEVYEVID